MTERNVHERDLYHIEGEDCSGNQKEVNTSAFGPAHAERIAGKWLKHVKRTECWMVGGGGMTYEEDWL